MVVDKDTNIYKLAAGSMLNQFTSAIEIEYVIKKFNCNINTALLLSDKYVTLLKCKDMVQSFVNSRFMELKSKTKK